MNGSRFILTDKTDAELTAHLERLIRRGNELLADVLAHLAQMDERKAYAARGFSSLYAYCVAVLNLPEDATYKRIQVARSARSFPLIFDLVASGALHLSGVCLLSAHLTAENHAELLAAASHKSKRQIEHLVAQRFARPDVPTSLRKLPTTAGNTTALHAANAATAGVVALPAPSPSSCAAAAIADPARATTAGCAVVSPSLPTTSTLFSPAPSAPKPALIEPLSAHQYRLQLTIGRETRDRLLQAQALLRHKLPHGDLAAVIDQALATFVEELEARKFKKRRRHKDEAKATAAPMTSVGDDNNVAPKQKQAEKASAVDHVPVTPPGVDSEVAPEPPEQVKVTKASTSGQAPAAPLVDDSQVVAPGRVQATIPAAARARHIPNEIKRAVALRDGQRCSFVASDGRRCDATAFLEYHHDVAFSRGGPHTVDNVFLRCKRHNLHAAVFDFGTAFMLQKIDESRARRSTEKLQPRSWDIRLSP